jgi:DNA-binding MarR family transcriptional regulator
MELAVPKESKKIPPPSSSESTIDAVNNRLFFRLVQCSNLYERGVQQHLNVSSVQGAVLGALSRNADRSMSFADLVEYLAVSRQNLDAVLKRLERLGYVNRVEDPEDRRVRIVRLTSRGHAFWTDLFQQSVRFYGKATVGITTDERKQLTALLVRIGQNLKRPDF